MQVDQLNAEIQRMRADMAKVSSVTANTSITHPMDNTEQMELFKSQLMENITKETEAASKCIEPKLA
jgi:hypothetical protein